MPEVSGSSSPVATARGTQFDLRSQAGVAELLRHLRASALPVATKSTIRELVLRYTRAGGDPGVREELETMLKDLPLSPGELPATPPIPPAAPEAPATAPVSEPTPAPEAPATIGSRRVPVFTVATVPAAPASASVPAAEQQSVPAQTPQSPPAPEPPTPPAPAPAPPSPTPTPEAPPPPPAPAAEEVVPAPTPTQPESPAASSPAPAPNVDHGARIQEIKREVIALVGNPVNLVDIDNAVGKQYMTALLESMKKVNGGTKAQAAEAMANLEAAFVAVQGIAPHSSPSPAPAEPAAPTPEAAPDPASAPSPEAHSQSTPPAPPPPPPASTATTSPSTPSSEPQPKSAAAEVPAPTPSKADGAVRENLMTDQNTWASEAIAQETPPDASAKESAADKKSDAPDHEHKLGGAPLQDIPTYGYSKPSKTVFAPAAASRNAPPSPPAPAGPAPTTPTPPPPAPPTTDAVPHRGAATANELMTPEITAGVSQLLSEWKIFKSSGLFGMGPGGMDHPLYQKLKDASMLAITNGTFEGASPEIQHSINDYINGWRYEQSITPQHSETFEHFLRRVVKRVLEQTKR